MTIQTLNREQAQRFQLWKKLQAQRNAEKKRRLLSYLINQIVLLEGKKGRGKTLSGVAISHQLRDYFNKPVIVVGTKTGLNENYGKFTFLNEKEFVAQLDKISDVANDNREGTEETVIEVALKTMGINIMDTTIVFDEAIKLFDARTPSDKLVRLFGYFVSQSRHYNITIIIMIPHRDNLDKRVRRQIDWFGRCTTTCKTLEGRCIRRGCPHITTVRFIGGIDRFKFKIYGPEYWNKYNSWAVVGFRASQLDIKKY